MRKFRSALGAACAALAFIAALPAAAPQDTPLTTSLDSLQEFPQ